MTKSKHQLLSDTADFFWLSMTKFVIKKFKQNNYTQILDIGFDQGASTCWMGQVESAETIIAFDNRLKHVNLLKKRFQDTTQHKKIIIINGSIETISLKSASMDAIFCRSVIQYTNYNKSLSEIKRILSKNGTAYVIAHLSQNPLISLFRKFRKLKDGTVNSYISYPELEKMRKEKKIQAHIESHLITPILFPIIESSFIPAFLKKALLLMFLTFENALLNLFPFLKRYCWYTLIEIKA